MHQPRHLTRWDYVILRVIAIYHLLKAAFFFALSFGLKHFLHHDIVQFLNDYLIEPFHFDPDGPFLKWLLSKASDITPHSLRFFSYVFFAYAIIFTIEGVGLYFRRRWAEYMVVIVVSSLLPFELYEIYLKLAWWKFALVVGNLLVVAFLVRQLMLGNSARRK